MKQKLILLFALLCSLCFLFSCSSDDDSSEIVTMYVSSETGTYYGEGTPRECMLVREEGSADWQHFLFGSIQGFTYEKGNAYILRVLKTKVEEFRMDDALPYDYRLLNQTLVEDADW